jgi:hypothetical protein
VTVITPEGKTVVEVATAIIAIVQVVENNNSNATNSGKIIRKRSGNSNSESNNQTSSSRKQHQIIVLAMRIKVAATTPTILATQPSALSPQPAAFSFHARGSKHLAPSLPARNPQGSEVGVACKNCKKRKLQTAIRIYVDLHKSAGYPGHVEV